MTISLNQSPTVLGTWSGSMASAALSGDTLFYVVTAYTSTGVTIGTSAPLYNGASVTGAVKLKEAQNAGVSGVYTAIWMLPNVSGSHTSVAITVTGADTPGDTRTVGLTVYDVTPPAGATATLDKSNSSSGTGTAVTSAASGSITELPEFVIGSLIIFGETMSPVGGAWTEPAQLIDEFQLSGYQIVTTGSSSYTYAQTASGSSGWAGVIVTVYWAATGHTATASLTVTPAFGATAVRGRFRTASLTVTPTLGATPAHGHHPTASLTVTPAFGAVPASDATASLTVTPAFGATPTLAAVASLTVTPAFGATAVRGHGRGASLTVTPSFSAAAVQGIVRAAALTVTPTFSAAAAHGHAVSAGLAVTPVLGAAASGGAVTVTVPASWSGSRAVPGGFAFPLPSARPVQVSVANTPGDWMIAIVTWRQATAGQGITVSVADDAHNWWEPLGAPTGDSAAAGVTRCAVWAAPAARAAANVQVAASGPYQALAVRILDVNGMLPWMTMTPVVTNFALAATSLALSAAAPSASAFLVACAGSDNNSDTVTGPGAGWTSLSAVAASNGVDHTADITLSSAWRVTSASAAAAWSSTGALDFSGVIAGVLVSAAAPSQPNPNWPVVITEIAPGAGAQTLPAALSWTPLSARTLSLTIQQGKQYTLSQLQAGQGTLVADNPDGALIPPGTGALSGIDSGTPVRQRVIIPSLASPYYVAFSGYMQRWPFAVPGDMLRGESQCTIVDVWAYAAGLLNSMAREEMLIDQPYACWPLDDPQGSLQGSNIAPGNSAPLTLTLSKYGAGGAAAVFGANSGVLLGDTSARISTATGGTGGGQGMFSQTTAGLSLTANGYGYALVCADPGYPPISGGVTIECFYQEALPGNGFFAFTAAVSGSNFNSATANLTTAGQPVTLLSGFSTPGGFTAATVYYVIPGSNGNFQLSATPGGSAITVTGAGSGFITLSTPYSPVIISARNAKGIVAEVRVRNTDGALILAYQTAAGAAASIVVDTTHDYRLLAAIAHVSLALTQTAWRVIVGGGGIVIASGTFAGPLAAQFVELDFGGVQDRGAQGSALPGYTALAAVYPAFLPAVRVLSHYWASLPGMVNEAACDRVERVLEYAGLTGRRWLGQQVVTGEGDLMVSGQDVGGQGAATSATNVAASTAPANLYVAPTGDIVYWSKLYSWNQPVKWTLGDNVAGGAGFILDEAGGLILDESGAPLLDESGGAGEIPFTLGEFSTDYDPARVVNDIQLTQLDTQTVTVPSGVTASTTLAAIEAASSRQYGDQPYQVTGYLTADATSAYTAGGSEVDLANWIADVNSKPQNRVQAVTVNAAANAANASAAAAWQFWAGACIGDMVQVNVRLPTAATSPIVSMIARISQTSRAGQFSQDGTSATIACVLDFAPEANALICDDPVRGLLNGQNALAW